MAHRMSTVGRGDRPCGTGFREDVDWRSGSIRVAGSARNWRHTA